MKAGVSLCALLLLALAGCATSSAPAPTPQPTRVLAAVTPLHPRLEHEAGHLLATITLLGEASHSLQTAYQMQDIQLPESARASLSDTQRHLQESQSVLTGISTPGDFRAVTAMLVDAYSLLGRARTEDSRHATKSRSDASAAATLLASAQRQLEQSPDARSSLAVQVESRVLQLATIVPPTPRPTPVVTIVKSVKQLVAEVTATPTPTKAPARQVRHVRAPKRSKILKRSGTATTARHLVHLVTKPVHAAVLVSRPTPKPTSAAVPARRASAGPSASSVPSLALSVSIVVSVLSANRAAITIRRCGQYLQSLSAGDDPLGSKKILHCVERAVATTREMRDAIAEVSSQPDSGVQAADAALGDLTQAELDVESAHTANAATRLSRARAQVGLALGSVMSSVRALGG